MGKEDYSDVSIQQIDGHQGEEEEEENENILPSMIDTTRVSDTFELPFPDMNKSLIGPEIINNWSFVI